MKGNFTTIDFNTKEERDAFIAARKSGFSLYDKKDKLFDRVNYVVCETPENKFRIVF